MPYNVGQGELRIVPSFIGIAEAITAEAEKWGESAGTAFGEAFKRTVETETEDTPLGPKEPESEEKGSKAGGAFADAFKARVDAALKSLPDASIDLNSTGFDIEIEHIRADLETLRGQKIGIDISDTEALAKLAELKAALLEIGHSSESIDVKVNTAAAITEIVALEDEVVVAKATLGDFGDDAGGAGGGIGALGEDAAVAGPEISAIIPAVVALGIALIPIAGLAGGALAALPAIFGGAGLGIGALVLGFSGVLPAITAYRATLNTAGETAAQVATKQRDLVNALAGLTPAGRGFVLFVGSELLPIFDQLKTAAQTALLPGITAGLQAALPFFRDMVPFITEAASGIGELADKFGQFLGSAKGQSEVNALLSSGAGFMQTIGNAALILFEAFTSVGSQAGPIVSAIGGGITNIVNAVAKWAEGGGFQKFLEWLRQNGPGIVSDISTFAKGVGSLVVALTPVGVFLLGILKPLGDFLGFLGKSPAALAAVSLALGGLGIALALALDTNPVGLIITAIGLLIVGITELVTHWSSVWGTIKSVFDDVVNFLRSGFGTLLLLPLGLVGVIIILALHWQQIWAGIQAVAGAVWTWLDGNVFQPLVNFFTVDLPGALDAVGGFFSRMVSDIEKILSTLEAIIEAPFKAAWAVIGPIVSGIKDAVGFITGSGGGTTPNSGASNRGGSPARASGGPVEAGLSYLIGERGMELFTPSVSGNITSNESLKTMNLTGPGGPVVQMDNVRFESDVDLQGLSQNLAFLSRGRRL